jgi:hypothetical protein
MRCPLDDRAQPIDLPSVEPPALLIKCLELEDLVVKLAKNISGGPDVQVHCAMIAHKMLLARYAAMQLRDFESMLKLVEAAASREAGKHDGLSPDW